MRTQCECFEAAASDAGATTILQVNPDEATLAGQSVISLQGPSSSTRGYDPEACKLARPRPAMAPSLCNAGGEVMTPHPR